MNRGVRAFAVVCFLLVLQQVDAAAQPMRIVSLAPSVTETIFALGYGGRLVGVTTYCNYPPEAQKIAKIGDFMNPSLEAVAAKRPDLVIGVVGATDPVKAREMERLGLKVVLLPLANLDDILKSARAIGALVSSDLAGKTLVEKISLQVDEVKRRVRDARRRKVLLIVGYQPVIAVGGKNFIDELITLAGGTNIAGSAAQPWLNIPDEYVVAKAPEVIIEAGMGSEREKANKRWSDLGSVPAVRAGRIYPYSSDKILRPGPRFGEALGELARFIHPECFSDDRNKRSGC
jgi:iron complex transport system substrate-binding protein